MSDAGGIEKPVERGTLAFHLMMAFCSDLAIHEPERLEKMWAWLHRVESDLEEGEDKREVTAAKDLVARIMDGPGSGEHH